ncbi:hypothetical protein ACFFG1_02090, partial [Sinomonas atrocyanea]|uniref:hypothetical protein n=1 Tax=Sinomonas atrocyanea TaxID=37927 RepID=UPI0035E98C52
LRRLCVGGLRLGRGLPLGLLRRRLLGGSFLRSALTGLFRSGALNDLCHPLVSRFMGELGQRVLLRGGIGSWSGLTDHAGRNRRSSNDGGQPPDTQEADDDR